MLRLPSMGRDAANFSILKRIDMPPQPAPTAEARLKTVQIRRSHEGGMEMSHGGEDPGRFFPECSPGAAPPGGLSGSRHSPGGAAPGLHSGEKPPWVLPAMAHFHPTFIGSPSLNRLEALLRCYMPGWIRGAALIHPGGPASRP